MTQFTDGLEKWVKKTTKNQKNKRGSVLTVEFLAVKKDVIDAMSAGYSMKTIWSYLTEIKVINSKYETFRQHVKRFIKADSNANFQQQKDKENEIEILAAKKSEEKKPRSKGFSFDPKPNKEDLI